MLLSTHFIVSLTLVSVLDFDHLIFYWIKFKNFNFKKAYGYFRDIALKKDHKEYKKVVRIFHSVEFVTLVAILSFYHKIFVLLLIGLVVHIIMDIMYEYPKFKSLSGFSLTLYINKKC